MVWHTKEKIVGIWTESSNLKDLDQVEELAVNIPHNGNGCLNMYNVALLHQELLGFGTYCFDDGFCKEILLVQAFYTFVKIDRC